jgi:hypothetical protein
MGWDTANGMSPDPGGCTSLQSRLVCAKCWVEPRIKDPHKITKEGSMLTITVCCHGEEQTKMIEMEKLVFTQKFFEDQAT